MTAFDNQTTDLLPKRRVYSIKEVAIMCGVSLSSMYRTVKLGYLRPLKGFGKSLFTDIEVERFLGLTRGA